jgi:hypothetical protein
MLPLFPLTTLSMMSIIGTKKHKTYALIFILKIANSKQKACLNNLGFKIHLSPFHGTKTKTPKHGTMPSLNIKYLSLLPYLAFFKSNKHVI